MKKKRLSLIVWAVFICLTVPIFVLSAFNVASADDFGFGQVLYWYVQEHGYQPLGILKSAVENMVTNYFTWQGRYSESFFSTFMPDIFGAYWLWAPFLYCFTAGAVILFFRTVFGRLTKGEYAFAGTICGVLTFCLIAQAVPYPVEAFFWFDGSMAYMFHHGIYLYMCSAAIAYLCSDSRKRSAGLMALLCLLTILAAGGNNVTAFVSILTYVIFLAIAFLLKKKWTLIFPAILSVVGFVVSYLSPGTSIRGGGEYQPILLTIRKCFVWTFKQYLLKWTSLSLILLLLILTPLLLQVVRHIRENHAFRFPFVLLLAVGDVCFLSAMSCPSFYVLGEPGPGRLRNVIFVSYVLMVVLSYGYFLGWLFCGFLKMEQIQKIAGLYDRLSIPKAACILVLFAAVLCLGNTQHRGTSVEAVREVISKEAQTFHAEAMARKELYEDPSLADVQVEPYSVKPYLLFFDDITDDAGNWKNVVLAMYYGKESVSLTEYDPDVSYD